MNIKRFYQELKNGNALMYSFNPTNEKIERKNVMRKLVSRLENIIDNGDLSNLQGQLSRVVNIAKIAVGDAPLKKHHKRNGIIIVFQEGTSLKIGWSCVHPKDRKKYTPEIRKRVGVWNALENAYDFPKTPEQTKHLLEYVPRVIHREFLHTVARAHRYYKCKHVA